MIGSALHIRPISLRQARQFVQEHHRHHDMPQGGLWAIALMDESYQRNQQTLAMELASELLGVAIAGRPVSRVLQRKGYCEIVRVCVLEGVPNGCSMLYGRCRRIAQLMGYSKSVTYTLQSETGVSLRAAGYSRITETDGGSWSRPSRPRVDSHPTEPKIRWEAA